jgi:3-oxoacyl-ACP reductase-like protein
MAIVPSGAFAQGASPRGRPGTEQLGDPALEDVCGKELACQAIGAPADVLEDRSEESDLVEQFLQWSGTIGSEPSIKLFAQRAFEEGLRPQVIEGRDSKLCELGPGKALHVLVELVEASGEQAVEYLTLGSPRVGHYPLVS